MQIFSADYLVPISSEPIYRGSIVLDGDKIAAVGPREEVMKMYGGTSEENFGAAAILPGFVNCHSHLEITAMRGFLDNVEHDFSAWLLRLNDTRSNRLSDADIEIAAVAGAIEGAAAGVTCFGDIGRYGKAGSNALKTVGLRGVVFQETNFSPDDRTANEDFTNLSSRIDELRSGETELVKIGVSPHSPYTVSPKLFSLIAGYAAAENLKVSIHASESLDEDGLMRNGIGFFTGIYEKFNLNWTSPRCSTIEFLAGTGIMRTQPLLAHCVHVSETDIDLIIDYSAAVAHCPKSNAKFGHGWAPLERFLDKGVKVGLGSDSVASNNVCDILEEGRFAALGARNRLGSERFVSANEILLTATLGGARSLGLDSIIGSLECGKQADLAIVSLEHAGQLPVHDVKTTLVFSSTGRDVIMTLVAGSEVYRKGRTETSGLNEQLEKLRLKMMD